MSLLKAEELEESEQYSEALELYKSLHQAEPKDLNILERLGHISMLLKNSEDAAIYYSKILEYDATSVLAYEQLMDIYINSNRYKYYIYRANLHSIDQKYEHAINDYKKALSHTQDEKEQNSTRFVLATLLEQVGQSVKAIEQYLRLIDSEFSHEEVYLKLANLYLKERAEASAVDIYERAIEHGFATEKTKEALAKLYIRTGNPQKALDISSNELTKIKAMLELGRFDDAKSSLDKVENDCVNNSEYYSLKAQYYYEQSDFDNALSSVDKYDELAKNSPITYQMRAMIYEDKKDDFNAHLNWGRFNLIRKDKDVAINEFLNAYQIKNDDISLVNNLAKLLEETGDKNHAMEFYERLIELDGADKYALTKLANFRESIGDYRGQIDYLEKIYALDKRDTLVILSLAQCYEKAKNKPDALSMYEKFIQLDYNNPDIEKIKARYDKLNNTEITQEEGLIDKIMNFFVRE
ncbi:MAG: tetratricopeptide repeat protein [Candidatus Gastranaerophilales bacterium]